MNKAVAKVLNSVLGDWVENLNGEQLKISVFSGSVQLDNLKLKSDVLGVLGLPLELRSGWIGHLEVEIPWTSLTSSPLIIEISEVFALVGPRADSDWNDEAEKGFLQKAKETSINQYEALSTAEISDNNDPGFTERLVSKIIDNVQVTIKSVYVRYEDTQFGIGIALTEAVAYTCNENWERMFVADSSVTYKFVGLKDFRMFLDYGDTFEATQDFSQLAVHEITQKPNHRFIIDPTGFSLKVVQNKDPKNLKIPQISATLVSEAFILEVEKGQIGLLLRLSNLFSTFNSFKEGVKRSIVERELTESEAVHYREVYKQWCILKKNSNQQLKESCKEKLDAIEKDITVESIVANRKIVSKQLKLQEDEENARRSIENLSKEPGTFSKLGNYFWGKSEEQAKAEEEEKAKAQKEAEDRLQEILSQQKSLQADMNRLLGETQTYKVSLPADYVQMIVNLDFPLLELQLKDDKTLLISSFMKDLSVKAGTRPSSAFVALNLKSSMIEDCLKFNPKVPFLLEGNAVDVHFDQYPSSKLQNVTSEFRFYLNLPALINLANVFLPVFSEVQIPTISSEATKAYVEKGQVEVTKIIQSEASLELDVNVKAPVFMIPVNSRNLQEGLLVLDLGELHGISSVESIEGAGEYDTYQFSLQNIRTVAVMSCEDIELWREAKHIEILRPMSSTSKLQKARGVPENADTLRLTLTITSVDISIEDELASFAVNLFKGTFKELEEFKSASPKVQEENKAIEMENAGIKEEEAVRDKLKKVETGFRMSLILQTESFSLAISSATERIALLTLGVLGMNVKVASNMEFQGNLELRELFLEDCRENVFFTRVIHTPKRDAPLFLVKFKEDPNQDKLSVKIRVSDLRMAPHPDLFIELMAFFTSHLKTLEALNADKPAAPAVQPQASSRTKSSLQRDFSFVLSNFELWLPIDACDPMSPVGCLSFGLSTQYDTDQRYQKTFAKGWRLLKTEFLTQNDEAQVDIKHITMFVGFSNPDQSEILPMTELFLLEPSRISLGYECSRKDNAPSSTDISLNLESMYLTIGFKDLKFMKQAQATWTKMQGESAPQEKAVKEPGKDKMSFKMECDSLQLSVVDDSKQPLVSLVHFNMSNIFGSMLMDPQTETKGEFSIYLIIDFYNADNGAWEPLIETWNFDVHINSADTNSIVSLSSERMLELNLTIAMAKAVGTAMSRLGEEFSYEKSQGVKHHEEGFSHGMFIYSFENALGCSFSVWLDSPTNKTVWTLDPSSSKDFSEEEISSLFSLNAKKDTNQAIVDDIKTTATFSVIIPGHETVRGLKFEKPCIYGFSIYDGHRNQECILNVYWKDAKRVIQIRSAWLCFNSMDFPLIFKGAQGTLEVPPGEQRPFPLGWEKAEVETKNGLINIFDSEVLEFDNDVYAVRSSLEFKTAGSVPQRYFWVSPAYMLRNSLPCTIAVASSNKDSICTILPGSVAPLSMFKAMTEDKVSFKLFLENDQEITTDLVPLEPGSLVPHGNFPASRLVLEKTRSKIPFVTKQRKMMSEKEAVGVFALDLHAQYIIVNKTSTTLECGQKSLLKIKANSVGFFKSDKNTLKFRAAGDEYGTPSDWSSGFNIKTVGVSGVIELDNSCVENAPKVLLYGLSMKNGVYPIEQSKIIYIVPRFLISNYLSFPIYVRQAFKNSEGYTVSCISPNDVLAYQLENASGSKTIRISRDGERWSSAFSLEEIEDFHVKFAGLEEDIKPEGEWFEPAPKNNFNHSARLTVSTKDSATLYLNIMPPGNPEFVIHNKLQVAVSVSQGTHPEVVVGPNEELPWVFDDLLIPKKVTISNDSGKQQLSIEKVGTQKQLGDSFIDVVVKGVTREVLIHNTKEIETENAESILTSKQKFVVALAGMGISIIDSKPSEKLYILTRDIHIKASNISQKIGEQNQVTNKFDFTVQNFQIDNMKSKKSLFPVIFCKTKDDDEEPTPFLQLKIHKVTTSKAGLNTSIDKIKWFELLLQEMTFKLNQDSIQVLLDLSGDLQNAFFPSGHLQKDYSERPSLTEVAGILDASPPGIIESPENATGKMYFEFIRLCAIKVVITFRTGGEDLEVSNTLAFPVFSFLKGFGSALANISDSPLYFTEILLQNSFKTTQELTSVLVKNYVRQGVFQFYKIIGSSDLIGNPVGLIDKLGTGVFEFVTEPSKGILKGPKAFAEGVSKGVRSLVGNVIAGSFGSVSKITGSLYSIMRQVEGEDAEGVDENDNALEKIGGGFTGGAIVLFEGVTGIFTKPWKGAQKEGVKGFFKGIGSGLIGLIVSPLSATLRLITGVSSGLSDAGALLAKGKIHLKGRSRFPRYIPETHIIEPYDSEHAQAQELLQNIDPDCKRKMIFYSRINENRGDIIIILTMNMLFQVVDSELETSMNVHEIKRCEVYRVDKTFFISIANDSAEILIESSRYHVLAKLYCAICLLPTSIDND